MSGHSHAKTVKRVKDAHDAQRGRIFSKISRAISVAAKEKGSDPNTNPKLRMAIEQAKTFNMPKDNVERAIKRGTDRLEGVELEEILFEAYGPGRIAIIIEGITDNKNRALGEIKQILNQHNGKLADSGSVKWLFERKGALEIQSSKHKDKKREDLEMLVIEAGVEDFYWHNDILDVYTKPEELEIVKKDLENREIKIESASLDWVAKENIELEKKEKEAAQKLFEALDESETVQEIYSNLKT